MNTVKMCVYMDKTSEQAESTTLPYRPGGSDVLSSPVSKHFVP